MNRICLRTAGMWKLVNRGQNYNSQQNTFNACSLWVKVAMECLNHSQRTKKLLFTVKSRKNGNLCVSRRSWARCIHGSKVRALQLGPVKRSNSLFALSYYELTQPLHRKCRRPVYDQRTVTLLLHKITDAVLHQTTISYHTKQECDVSPWDANHLQSIYLSSSSTCTLVGNKSFLHSIP